MLSNTLRLNFCHLKIIHIRHTRCHPKIIGHFLKNKEKNKFVFIHGIIWLIMMEAEMGMGDRSHGYCISGPCGMGGPAVVYGVYEANSGFHVG